MLSQSGFHQGSLTASVSFLADAIVLKITIALRQALSFPGAIWWKREGAVV